MHFHVVFLRPTDHVHADALVDVMSLVIGGLQELGHRVTVADNRWTYGAINILFGPTILPWDT
jgi:hypothetical protein